MKGVTPRQWGALAVALALAALYLFPLYWMYVSGMKTESEIFRTPPTLVPDDPQFHHLDVFLRRDMARYMANSLIIAAGTTALTLPLGVACAYVLSRYRSLWISIALFLILVLQVLPPSLMAAPLFIMFHQVDLVDTRLAVILALTGKTLPLFIILCRTTFLQVPNELEEAALVDGCSRVGAFWKINLPLARNGILVIGALIFMQSYGEYVYSASLLSSEARQPATVGLADFMGPNINEWVDAMVFSSLYVTPLIVVFVLLQRRIVQGLTAGALK